MQIFVFGLNHKRAPVEIREKVAFSALKLKESLGTLKEAISGEECLILSTCNRVEIYAATQDPQSTREKIAGFLMRHHQVPQSDLSRFFYEFAGREAVEHLFKVASGLDSLVLGENEVLGQAKTAFQSALEAKTCQAVLAQAFERSFQCAKEIKTKTRINEGATSVSSVAVELAGRIFGQLHGEKVLILGSGKMSLKTLRYLQKAGVGSILVSNRTHEKAIEMAEEFGAEAIPFEGWLPRLKDVDIVISSTAAPHIILKAESVREAMRERRHKPLFIIDIAVPRDVEGAVNGIDDVYLYNIDDLKVVTEQNTKIRAKELPKCYEIIAHRTDEFMSWMNLLGASPVIQRLDRHFDEVVTKEVGDFIAAELGGKMEPEKKDLLIRKLKGELLQLPLKQIKKASKNGALVRTLESLISIFQLDRFDASVILSEAKDLDSSSQTSRNDRKEKAERDEKKS